MEIQAPYVAVSINITQANILQGIPITDLTVSNISGDGGVDSDGYNIVIVCGEGACSDWTWSEVSVSGGQDYDDCQNVPSPPGSCSSS
jgi:polygalacturonase